LALLPAVFARPSGAFAAWCEDHGIKDLGQVRALHVADYVVDRGKIIAAPSVKLQLAAIRMLFDWLVVSQ
jgi:site-specific recombinase XerD